MCNVIVVFRTATVGSTLHILPCGTVSTFYIVNLHSQTSTHTEEKFIIMHKCSTVNIIKQIIHFSLIKTLFGNIFDM